MPQIQILAGSPRIIEGVSTKSGSPKAYRMVRQAAVLIGDDGVTESFNWQPPKGEEPLAPGKYALGARPFVMNGDLRLVPVLSAAGGSK